MIYESLDKLFRSWKRIQPSTSPACAVNTLKRRRDLQIGACLVAYMLPNIGSGWAGQAHKMRNPCLEPMIMPITLDKNPGGSVHYERAGWNGNWTEVLKGGLVDFRSGFALWRLWVRLGWNDILQRYRRSLLGPFWLTASMAIMVIALGILYAEIFRIPIGDFLPFLCVGLLVWNFLSSFLVEGGALFTGAESYIKQVRLPYSVYVYRSAWSKLVIFAHNSVIYFGVLLYFQTWPGLVVLAAIPGLLLVLVNGALANLCIGMISARFRDVPQLVSSVVQIVFFVTPIMWKPELLQSRRGIVEFNPFFHLIEVVRAPLLGTMPSRHSYLAVLLITLVNVAISGALFARFRSRISYWI